MRLGHSSFPPYPRASLDPRSLRLIAGIIMLDISAAFAQEALLLMRAATAGASCKPGKVMNFVTGVQGYV